VTKQPFPPGADTHRGLCDGVYCRDDFKLRDVVDALVGETYRQAGLVRLCANCLADFAVMATMVPPDVKMIQVDFPDGHAVATEIPHLRVWAKGADGLFHEVRGEVGSEVVDDD